ncbi:hypothetical protein WOLCODRAFT_147206 [Wolfiporia cocos MD-104 SS10]|uniref:Uncharacterized protein n=1 Tax=Wolfiporia cocos (strain MD-104) TaxID=742152 RepID=A0A2H3J8X1_WOLCO|nr:hypothetical protein WOLCODRAFT_147206 [Wolfiporia cocos MD-104 SS10]
MPSRPLQPARHPTVHHNAEPSQRAREAKDRALPRGRARCAPEGGKLAHACGQTQPRCAGSRGNNAAAVISARVPDALRPNGGVPRGPSPSRRVPARWGAAGRLACYPSFPRCRSRIAGRARVGDGGESAWWIGEAPGVRAGWAASALMGRKPRWNRREEEKAKRGSGCAGRARRTQRAEIRSGTGI